jgi:hypothetical protein
MHSIFYLYGTSALTPTPSTSTIFFFTPQFLFVPNKSWIFSSKFVWVQLGNRIVMRYAATFLAELQGPTRQQRCGAVAVQASGTFHSSHTEYMHIYDAVAE